MALVHWSSGPGAPDAFSWYTESYPIKKEAIDEIKRVLRNMDVVFFDLSRFVRNKTNKHAHTHIHIYIYVYLYLWIALNSIQWASCSADVEWFSTQTISSVFVKGSMIMSHFRGFKINSNFYYLLFLVIMCSISFWNLDKLTHLPPSIPSYLYHLISYYIILYHPFHLYLLSCLLCVAPF
jgi:hypothetical protein